MAFISIFLFVYPREASIRLRLAIFPAILSSYNLLSAFWSHDFYVTLRSAFEFSSCVALAYFLNIRFDAKVIAQILLHVLGVSLVLSVIWVVIFPGVAVHSSFDVIQDGHTGDWRGIYFHKNSLGDVAGFAVPLLFGTGFTLSRNKPLICLYLVAAILCVINANSGTGITLAAVGLLAFAVFNIPRRDLRHTAIMSGVAIGFIALVFSDQLMGTFLEMIGKDPTLTGRTLLWEAALKLIAESPLIGYGYPAVSDPAISDVFMAVNKVTNTHNAFLHILIETGIFGLALWSLMIWSSIKSLASQMSTDRVAPETIFFSLVIAMCLAAAMSEISAFDIVNSLMGIFLMITLITVSCQSARPSDVHQGIPTLRKRRRWRVVP